MFWQLAVPILGLVCSGVFQNFLGYRTILVPFVTILFHTNGLCSCPVRSFFVRTFLPSDFWYVFFKSRYLVRRMSMALTIFRDFLHLAGTTARCAPDGVLAALFPGSARV